MTEEKALVVSHALAKSAPRDLWGPSSAQLAPMIAAGATLALTWGAGKLVRRLLAARQPSGEVMQPQPAPQRSAIVIYHRSITIVRREDV